MKDNLLKSITPYKAPEVIKTIMQTCSMIDDYIANPSEELLAKVFLKYLCM